MGKSLFRLAAENDLDATKAWYYGLSPDEQLHFDYDWTVHGRPEQLIPPGAWHTWLCLAGRGWGKTRTGAEYSLHEAYSFPNGRGALVGQTGQDVWDVMVHGESGIIARAPPWFMPETYERTLIFPNGCQIFTYSAETPRKLRGPQHHFYWADEMASWQYPETWDMLLFGMRLGNNPRGIVTTTPRPTTEIRKLVEDAKPKPGRPALTVISTGSTYDNEDNLPETFLHDIISRYEDTRLGQQEIYAIVLDDTPGALWKRDTIEACRVKEFPELLRIVVAIDPAVSTKDTSAETGMIVAGIGMCGCRQGRLEKHGFVLYDGSGRFTPFEWGTRAVGLYRQWKAHRIIAETNNGGDLVISNIESIDPTIYPFEVKASDGKRTRAEPVSALYEQTRVHHVGVLPKLEDQMCTWAALTKGERSPDRVDALVWAISYLMLDVETVSVPARPVIPWGGAGGRRLAR